MLTSNKINIYITKAISLAYKLAIVLLFIAEFSSCCGSIGDNYWANSFLEHKFRSFFDNDSKSYSRGIGIYPGNPNEDFSPKMLQDNKEYRNIALNRMVYQSSSFDYNLTSQLLTDGIITDVLPKYLCVETQNGYLPKREKEWSLDGGPYSRNSLEGESVYIKYELNNYALKFDKVRVSGKIVHNNLFQKKGCYTIECLAIVDNKFKKIGELQKTFSFENNSRKIKAEDVNKQSETVSKFVTNFEETIDLDKNISSFTKHISSTASTPPTDNISPSVSTICLKFKMKGAIKWDIIETTFSEKDKPLDIKPSNYFSSSWMSETTGQEWVYVDFGVKSKFNKIVLSWVNKAIDGEIQVSNDAKSWKKISNLPSGDLLKDEINVKGKGRYVRILMNKSINGKNYILSELEIYGKGGLTPNPSSPSKPENNILSLSGGAWRLQRASQVQGSGYEISSSDYDYDKWICATVPGTVFSTYMNIGAVPSPLFSDNQLVGSESFFNSNFWYRNEFVLPDSYKKDRVFLNFDGINWKANIYLNGSKVGRIEGAFKRGIFDVTDQLCAGKNVLAVEIEKNDHIGAVKEQNKYSTDFNGGILGADNPTFHATIGWDWIPTVRGRNIGIWNDVYLSTTGVVTLSDPYVRTELNLPDTTLATLTPQVFVTNHSDEFIAGCLQGRVEDISFEKTVELQGNESKRIVFSSDEFKQLIVENPSLWWPNGYGEQYLYDASFSFIINPKASSLETASTSESCSSEKSSLNTFLKKKNNKSISDKKNFKLGLREMTYTVDDGILNIYVNGRRFVGKGGNWGFSELNLNYRQREYDAAVKYHKDMNLTMIRNWVGMIGDEEFYEACDKYGIVIWQDFWLANPSDGPDPYNNKMFLDNAEDYVKRIRNHASIGLYCGRNEGFPPQELDSAFRSILAENHNDIYYISSSAHGVVSGFGPYRRLLAKEYFSLTFGNDKLHSERGMPNVLTYDSFKRTISPENMWPQSDEWGMHDFTLKGAQFGESFNQILENSYGKPNSAEEFCDLAQFVNYDGHRALFESRSNYRKGLLMWMSHSCWPSMVWHTYDYFLQPGAGYFGIKKAAEPLHIQWNQSSNKVEVVNYSAGNYISESQSSLLARASIYNLDGTLSWRREVELDCVEDSTNELFELDFSESLSKVQFVKLELFDNDRKVLSEIDEKVASDNDIKVLSDNFYLYGKDNDYKEIYDLSKVDLCVSIEEMNVVNNSVDKGNDNSSFAEMDTNTANYVDSYMKVKLKNPSSVTTALMIKLNLLGAKNHDQILPVIYSDNYFSLLPNEEKTITITWNQMDTRGNRPTLEVSGFNISKPLN